MPEHLECGYPGTIKRALYKYTYLLNVVCVVCVLVGLHI